jgi:hypothetical protein
MRIAYWTGEVRTLGWLARLTISRVPTWHKRGGGTIPITGLRGREDCKSLMAAEARLSAAVSTPRQPPAN